MSNCLFFPMTKKGRSRRVPLSQAALDVIDALSRVCDYLSGTEFGYRASLRQSEAKLGYGMQDG